ncbi:hypothetical protein FPV67DRAFT_570255 [Lyophyllum atratum]|nr:hypothetical protein FPV67DRAFT_570255 [Lyophyllum atratum]
MASQGKSRDPRINLDGLDRAHFHLPITDINLCAHFDARGVCDERTDLSFRPKRGNHEEPPRANHFSLWFGFGGQETVVLDVTQPGYPFNPYASDDYLNTNTCLVRLFSEKIPSDLDMGCVHREQNLRQGITVAHIIELIKENERQGFLFLSNQKQKVGCRQWVHTIAKDLERAGITSRGYADAVLKHLRTYYGRFQVQDKGGRWVKGTRWAPRPEFECPELQKGLFPSATRSRSRF